MKELDIITQVRGSEHFREERACARWYNQLEAMHKINGELEF